MSDYAFDLLCTQLATLTENQQALWVVDENISINDIIKVAVSKNLLVMTNRYDLSQALSQRGFSVLLNDFDFSSIEKESLDKIYYRVSKEKPIVHHIINQAGRYLAVDGELCLAGFKNEGTKTYIEKAKNYLGDIVEKQRGSNGVLLACLTKCDSLSIPLDDQNYTQAITISVERINNTESLKFSSKPGIYGWKKIDQGSEFLIEHFNQFLEGLDAPPATIMDLGCGFGYLSVLAAQQCKATFTATDNNISSVALCEQNFQRHNITGHVVLDDCAAGIDDLFDIVLCNPPFHQGFDVSGDLTIKFLTAAKRLLKPKGQAFFVVNSFIPLEKKSKSLFSSVELLANNGSFKLLALKV